MYFDITSHLRLDLPTGVYPPRVPTKIFYVYAFSCIQQEEGSFYQHIGFVNEEEASEVLHLERSFIWG
jgi:hypothetical protein